MNKNPEPNWFLPNLFTLTAQLKLNHFNGAHKKKENEPFIEIYFSEFADSTGNSLYIKVDKNFENILEGEIFINDINDEFENANIFLFTEALVKVLSIINGESNTNDYRPLSELYPIVSE